MPLLTCGDIPTTPAPTGRRKKAPDLGAGQRVWIAALVPFLKLVIGIVLCLETTQIAKSERRIGIESESTTKTRLSESASVVDVFNCTDQKQSLVSPQNVMNLLLTENRSVTDRPCQSDARTYRCESAKAGYSHIWTKRHFIVRRSLRQAFARMQENGNIIDPRYKPLSVTDVNDVQIDFEWAVSSPCEIFSKPHMFQTHLWSMRRKKFVSSEFNRLIGDTPQFFSRKPQPAGENGQDGSESRDCSLSMFVEKVDQPFEAQKERPAQGGALVGMLVVYGLIGFASYWMARKQG